MGLSSNSVIHFTKSLRSLNGILSKTFKINYCRETIKTKGNTFDYIVPMVSFCDIPFSQILNHVDSYGCYGIGLKKEWAEEKGLNPVLYVEKNSQLSDHFFIHMMNKIGKGTKTVSSLNQKERYIFDIMRYVKNYQGELKRWGKKTIVDYRFSDEREWRYVVHPDEDHMMIGNVSNFDYNRLKEAKAKLNESIISKSLGFEPNDISYIIIKEEKERDEIIRNLERVKSRFPLEEVRRLTSRILSVEQIRTDF